MQDLHDIELANDRLLDDYNALTRAHRAPQAPLAQPQLAAHTYLAVSPKLFSCFMCNAPDHMSTAVECFTHIATGLTSQVESRILGVSGQSFGTSFTDESEAPFSGRF